jgi:hypothetical protein
MWSRAQVSQPIRTPRPPPRLPYLMPMCSDACHFLGSTITPHATWRSMVKMLQTAPGAAAAWGSIRTPEQFGSRQYGRFASKSVPDTHPFIFLSLLSFVILYPLSTAPSVCIPALRAAHAYVNALFFSGHGPPVGHPYTLARTYMS